MTLPHMRSTAIFISVFQSTAMKPFNPNGQEIQRSLEKYLDIVVFTEEVPQLRHYLTTRFAAPNGVLTPEEEGRMKQTSVSEKHLQESV